ncbi:MAG: shikimate kinase [Nitrospiraceae bacterium]|nr:MAG: shikimate kinase [Nitrospiraceae bacterium]
MEKNIVLTGFMGTGKNAVGRQLAKKLDMRLLDVDAEIEARQNMSIDDIFKTYGEKRFRDIETEMLQYCSEKRNVIIATGGGAVLREENMAHLRKNGIIFCLIASPETIYKRTSRSDKRPLLNVENPMAKIKELLEYRRPFYEKAGIMIDTDKRSPLEIAEEIVEIVKCRR